MDEEIKKKLEAQARLQKEKDWPDFAPKNGICFNCRSQIYEAISLEKASTKLITGCPYCNRSYCD